MSFLSSVVSQPSRSADNGLLAIACKKTIGLLRSAHQLRLCEVSHCEVRERNAQAKDVVGQEALKAIIRGVQWDYIGLS